MTYLVYSGDTVRKCMSMDDARALAHGLLCSEEDWTMIHIFLRLKNGGTETYKGTVMRESKNSCIWIPKSGLVRTVWRDGILGEIWERIPINQLKTIVKMSRKKISGGQNDGSTQ